MEVGARWAAATLCGCIQSLASLDDEAVEELASRNVQSVVQRQWWLNQGAIMQDCPCAQQAQGMVVSFRSLAPYQTLVWSAALVGHLTNLGFCESKRSGASATSTMAHVSLALLLFFFKHHRLVGI